MPDKMLASQIHFQNVKSAVIGRDMYIHNHIKSICEENCKY